MDAGQILDTALQLAAERGWDALHLHDVAQALGIGLTDLQRHVPHKDALAEVLFDRAERALVAAGDTPAWADLPARERLARALWAWFDTLAPHRRTAAAMLRYKLQPDHLHLQAAGLMRISRTVQWIRETAQLPAVGARREIEEVVLTGIFLGAVGTWFLDQSPGARHTRAWLERRLAWAELLAMRFSNLSASWMPSRMR
jgi:AcrR family transcriptional regulator